ncbi:Asp-tRNA(Asn)/Glu-tRNA(Gln) amidotransferase subunit GatA [Bernardetia sp.]|uniref:Asp-tRNA(Asn)/Glu-tRNA(Gln) amidotransferase subunit GatA n=1 Tax=Bernardetia sp. TaxID=1937974 RepID=UPI0025C59B2B|nr:Asp-tRNA(Asn)/Glu-tRNA(Gln) amidotransferase subunit GatA [Bernardetia sp.]
MKTYIDSFASVQKALQDKKTTCAELVENYLKVIHEKNPSLNAFLEVYDEEAKAQAKLVDEKIQNGTAGKLAGMIVGLKDVLCHKDHKLSASSKMLEGFVSQFDGTAVERLLKEDAIVIGRQNCDEFAMGSSNENSAFGVVKNEVGNNRVPGGSSGGSAVAVQAGMCMVSLGSDTGGSVRQPAAFCGIVGLKPTYSRISRYGLIAFASSFDSIGIFANNAADVAITLEVIAGKDDNDSTVSQKEVPAYSEIVNTGVEKKPKIAYFKETLHSEGLSEEIKAATVAKLEKLKNEGYEVEEVDFSLLKYALPTYYILITAEASTNLSRYDGVRYGFRSPNVTDLESMYKKTRTEGFGKEVKRRIMLGTFVLSASYYDAYFTKAQKVRRKIQEAMKEVFKQYDFIISPTTPTTAFEIGKYEGETVELYLADLFTVPASVVGIPAISIPNGTDKEGLPIGLQIMGDYFSEDKLLAFSNELMK